MNINDTEVTPEKIDEALARLAHLTTVISGMDAKLDRLLPKPKEPSATRGKTEQLRKRLKHHKCHHPRFPGFRQLARELHVPRTTLKRAISSSEELKNWTKKEPGETISPRTEGRPEWAIEEQGRRIVPVEPVGFVDADEIVRDWAEVEPEDDDPENDAQQVVLLMREFPDARDYFAQFTVREKAVFMALSLAEKRQRLSDLAQISSVQGAVDRSTEENQTRRIPRKKKEWS